MKQIIKNLENWWKIPVLNLQLTALVLVTQIGYNCSKKGHTHYFCRSRPDPRVPHRRGHRKATWNNQLWQGNRTWQLKQRNCKFYFTEYVFVIGFNFSWVIDGVISEIQLNMKILISSSLSKLVWSFLSRWSWETEAKYFLMNKPCSIGDSLCCRRIRIQNQLQAEKIIVSEKKQLSCQII